MKIVVAIKQVPERGSALRPSGAAWIDENGLDWTTNEPDAYALEAGLLLRDAHGGEVVALCAGPESAAKTVREAFSKGADRGIHISADHLHEAGSLTTAQLLAAAIRAEQPDLVLTGLQSDDLGGGQTGVVLSELLGVPCATIVMAIEKQENAVRVKRELESGWFQYATLPLPAVLTIQSGIAKLRYSTLMAIKRARSKEIQTLTPESLGVSIPAATARERVTVPERTKETVWLRGEPGEVARQLADKLVYEVRAV